MVTTLLVDSYKQLQPDWGEYTAQLLFATIVSQQGSGNVTAPVLLPPSAFSSLGSSRWINGLWLCSLVVSLVVALLCILGKQWLDEYNARVFSPARTERDWSRRRALYYDGVVRWHLPELMSLLPVLLHIALFLFISGLVVFFQPLDLALSYYALASTLLIGIAYFSTGVWTYYYVDCPFYTPVCRYMHWPFEALGRAIGLLHQKPDANAYMECNRVSLEASVLAWMATSSPVQDVAAVAIFTISALNSSTGVLQCMRQYKAPFWTALESQIMRLYTSLNQEFDFWRENLRAFLHFGAELSPAQSQTAYKLLRVQRAVACLSSANSPDGPAFVVDRARAPDLLLDIRVRHYPLHDASAGLSITINAGLILAREGWENDGILPAIDDDYDDLINRLDDSEQPNIQALCPAHAMQTLDLMAEVNGGSKRLSLVFYLVHGCLSLPRREWCITELLVAAVRACASCGVEQLPLFHSDESEFSAVLKGLELYSHVLSNESKYRLDANTVHIVCRDFESLLRAHAAFQQERYYHEWRSYQRPSIERLCDFLGCGLFDERSWSTASVKSWVAPECFGCSRAPKYWRHVGISGAITEQPVALKALQSSHKADQADVAGSFAPSL